MMNMKTTIKNGLILLIRWTNHIMFRPCSKKYLDLFNATILILPAIKSFVRETAGDVLTEEINKLNKQRIINMKYLSFFLLAVLFHCNNLEPTLYEVFKTPFGESLGIYRSVL